MREDFVMKSRLSKELHEIADFIKKNFGAKKVILFGSYACGNPTEDSI